MKKQIKSSKVRVNLDSNDYDIENIDKLNSEKSVDSIKKIRKGKIREHYAINDEKVDNGIDTIRQGKRISSAKIRVTKADKEIEQSDNISVVMMIVIIAVCFVAGIAIGYLLYNLALSSSNVAFIVGKMLKL